MQPYKKRCTDDLSSNIISMVHTESSLTSVVRCVSVASCARPPLRENDGRARPHSARSFRLRSSLSADSLPMFSFVTVDLAKRPLISLTRQMQAKWTYKNNRPWMEPTINANK